MFFLSLLWFLLLALSPACPQHASAQEISPSLNIVEFDEQHQEIANDANDIQNWQKVKRVSIEELNHTLADELKEKTIDTANTRNINLFLPYINAALRDLSRQKDEQWTQEYLELVQKFNQSKMDFQDFKQSINKFEAALNNLSAIKKRQYTTKEVYLQNLEGIDTMFLVLGIVQWDGKKPIEDLVNPISDVTKGVGYFISDELSDNLIFSKTTVINSRIYKDVIISHRGGRVESVETDPFVHQKEYNVYVLQKYRCFPRFQRLTHEGGDHEFYKKNKEFIFEGINEWNVAEIFSRYPDLSELFKNKVKKDLQELSEQNGSFHGLFQRLSEKYNQDMAQINFDIDKIKKEIYAEITLLSSKLRFIEPNGTLEGLSQFKEDAESFMNLRDDEEDSIGKKQKEKLIGWLQDKLKNYENYYLEFETKLVEKNNSRRRLIFTIKEELLHKDQSSDELAQSLLSQALKTLNDRKKQLTSYTISVVENKELISRDMVNFYDSGKIIRYLMLSPVQSFSNYGQSGSDTPKLSLLLSMEVEFSKKNTEATTQDLDYEDKKIELDPYKPSSPTPPAPAPVTSPKNISENKENIILIPQKEMALLILENHCSSFERFEELNFEDFNLPSIEQIAYLRDDLLENESTLKKFSLKANDLIWANQKTVLGRKVYSLSEGRTNTINEETGCAFFIGIKRYVNEVPSIHEQKVGGCGCR